MLNTFLIKASQNRVIKFRGSILSKRFGNSWFQNGGKHTTLNKEKLTQLIRKFFREELKKQEVHITNIVSSNFKTKMEEIKKS